MRAWGAVPLAPCDMLLVVPATLPTPTLTGPICSVRRWELSDVEALRLACGDPDICRFTTVPHEYTVEGAREWIARQHSHAERGTAIVLAATVPESVGPCGMVGLFGLGERGLTARLGYWVVASYRGRGVAGDAMRLLADWAFEELALHAIYIDREPQNLASARVAEGLGATVAGRHSVELDGTTVELVRHVLSTPDAEVAEDAEQRRAARPYCGG